MARAHPPPPCGAFVEPHSACAPAPPAPARRRDLPSGVSGLSRLQELSLQGNPELAILPDALGMLPALRELSAADCGLAAVPASLGSAGALETLSLYGNQLRSLPPGLLQVRGLVPVGCRGCPCCRACLPGAAATAAAACKFEPCNCGSASSRPSCPPPLRSCPWQAPKLKTVWLESNPLTPEAVAALLEALPASSVSALGLDESQLEQLPLAQRERLVAAAGPKLRVSRIVPPPAGSDGASSSSGAPGYFKLDPAPAAAAAAGNGSSWPSAEVLVVSFGSAPGTPNWGGLLKKVRAAATAPQVWRTLLLASWWDAGAAAFFPGSEAPAGAAAHVAAGQPPHHSRPRGPAHGVAGSGNRASAVPFLAATIFTLFLFLLFSGAGL